MTFKFKEGGWSFLFDEVSVAELHLSIFKACDRATEKAFLFLFSEGSFEEPRLTSWYGELPYTYSRITMQPNPHVCICAQFPFTVVCKIKTLQRLRVNQSLLSSFYLEHIRISL